MDSCKKKVKGMNAKLKLAKAEAEAEEAKLNELIAKADALEAKNSEDTEELCKLEDEVDAIESKLLASTGKLTETEKTGEERRHAKNQLEANHAKDGSKRSRLEKELEDMKARGAGLTEKIAAIAAEHVQYEEQLDEHEEKYETHEEKVKELESETTSVSNVLRSAETAEAETARRSEQGMSEIEKLSLKYQDVEKAAIAFEEQAQAGEEKVDELEAELAGLKEKHAKTLLDIQAAVNEINDM